MSAPSLGTEINSEWGSDKIAELLHLLDFPYAVIVPGASFRGLHDSIVNLLGNRQPQLVTCLHENHAVSIADGYSRVTEKPLIVILHSNVGVMNGSMGIYNAWCDRRPILILGATGPVDAHERRPWIDWIHTSKDQGALIRPFVKWDDQPASAEAAIESILRANQITRVYPAGPVYVCLDAGMQEAALNRSVPLPDTERFRVPPTPAAAPDLIADAHEALIKAKKPLILAGRVSRDSEDWERRIAFAEIYGTTVLTSTMNAPAFPVDHALHVLPPCGEKASELEAQFLTDCDLILSLDWLDLAGFLRARTGQAQTLKPHTAKIIHVSLDGLLANGWSMDHQALPPIDVPLMTHPDVFIRQMLAHAGKVPKPPLRKPRLAHWTEIPPKDIAKDRPFDLLQLAYEMSDWAETRDVTFARLPIGWPQAACRFRHPLSFLGKDGGGAVGTGPAHTVGAALALKGSGRIVVGVIGDGDFSMGMNALWTASNQDLPMMLVIANNQSYFNDEVHQERVAIQRHRPRENKGIGQRLDTPELALGQIAAAQGFEAGEPARTLNQFREALERGTRIVESGGRVLIDARITPGYAS